MSDLALQRVKAETARPVKANYHRHESKRRVNEGSCRIERTSMIFAAFDDTERAPRSVRTRPDAGC